MGYFVLGRDKGNRLGGGGVCPLNGIFRHRNRPIEREGCPLASQSQGTGADIWEPIVRGTRHRRRPSIFAGLAPIFGPKRSPAFGPQASSFYHTRAHAQQSPLNPPPRLRWVTGVMEAPRTDGELLSAPVTNTGSGSRDSTPRTIFKVLPWRSRGRLR